jgi:putative membrane protein
MTSLATLPGFITHFLAGLVLLGAAIFVHVKVTPHDEMALLRRGNTAAAVAFGGTVLGFAIPLHSAIAHSANLVDAAVWGVVALAAQLGAWFAVARLLGSTHAEAMEEEGAMARAVVKAAVAVAVGALNAGAMSS